MVGRTHIRSLGVAVLSALCAYALSHCFSPALGSRVPFLLYALAVAVAAQFAGAASGLIVTGLGIILVASHAPASDVPMHTVLLIFGVVGMFLSFCGGLQQRTQERLRDAYERIALKHDVARMGTFEWFVPQGRLEWSPEMEKIYGIETRNHVHTVDEWRARVHPDDAANAFAGLDEPVRLNLPTFDQTYRIIRPDGEMRWIHTRRKYRYDAHGRAVHVIGVNLDVTELKRGELAQQILGGLIQLCSACGRIRVEGEREEWCSMERYVSLHSAAKVSHGMCPDCGTHWFPEEPLSGQKAGAS